MDTRKILIGLFCMLLIAVCCSQAKSEKFTYSDFLKQLAKGSFEIKIDTPKAIKNATYNLPCGEWKVSADQLIESFINSKVVSGEEYSMLYDWYPCEITGSFYNKRTKIIFKVNMANTAIVTNKSFGELKIVFKNAVRSFEDSK
ncbi:MAG: hypothetical protein PVG39_18625 [Desulfobacteraceae bacterium]